MASPSSVPCPAISPFWRPCRWQIAGLHLLLFFIIHPGMAQNHPLPATLTTRDGVTYDEVIYTRHDPASVYFIHRDGAASVPLTNLSPALQKTLGYDRDASEATVAVQSAAREKHAETVAAIRLIEWKEAERRAQLRNVKREDIVRISGVVIEKNGKECVIACRAPVSRVSATVNPMEFPRVQGVITLSYHPHVDSLLANDSIDCLATASEDADEPPHFDFVEAPPTPASTAPRAFPPTLLERILAKERAGK